MKTITILHKFLSRITSAGKVGIKLHLFIVALTMLCPIISFGQNEMAWAKGLAPVRGNYKTLQSLSPKPKSANLDIDKVKFPFDQSWADKVLSIKPVYLVNNSVNDFKIPDPPANSSDQTRAELNYLLKLQYNRTLEDITTSIYLSNNPESPSDVGQDIGYWTASQKLP